MNRPKLLQRLVALDRQLSSGGITLAAFAEQHSVTVGVIRSDLRALEQAGQVINRRRFPGEKAYRYFYFDAAQRPVFAANMPEVIPPSSPGFMDGMPVW